MRAPYLCSHLILKRNNFGAIMNNDNFNFIETASTLSPTEGIEYFNLHFNNYVVNNTNLLDYQDLKFASRSIDSLTHALLNESNSSQHLLTSIICTLHDNSNKPYIENKQFIKDLYLRVSFNVFEKALQNKNDELIKLIINLRKSVSTSSSNAFQFLMPTDLELLQSILETIESCYTDFDTEALIHQVQFVLERHLLEPQFKDWISLFNKHIPEVIFSVDYTNLISRSISSFKPESINSILPFIKNDNLCSLNFSNSFRISKLPDDLTPDAVLDILQILSKVYTEKNVINQTNSLINLSLIFNACSNSSDFSILTHMASHPLFNTLLTNNLISDEAKAVYLSINLADSLEESIAHGLNYNNETHYEVEHSTLSL